MVRTDSQLNSNDLITLAKQLKNLSASKVRTLTIPLSNSNGIGADELASLLQRGRQAVAEVDAFETPNGRAQFWGNAIVYDLSPCPELSTIHHALTDVSAEFLPGPRPDHFTPHITFSYAHAAGDSTATINAIADPSLDLPTFRIESVWLLDVAREPGPERGWYSWNVIGEAPLRTTADL